MERAKIMREAHTGYKAVCPGVAKEELRDEGRRYRDDYH